MVLFKPVIEEDIPTPQKDIDLKQTKEMFKRVHKDIKLTRIGPNHKSQFLRSGKLLKALIIVIDGFKNEHQK